MEVLDTLLTRLANQGAATECAGLLLETVSGESPAVDWAGTNTLPKTFKSTICGGKRPGIFAPTSENGPLYRRGYFSAQSERRERNSNQIVVARRAPLAIFWIKEDRVAAARRHRVKAARPAPNDRIDAAMVLNDLARAARLESPSASICPSWSNRARLISLSAINNRFRDSSGLTRSFPPNIRGPFGVVGGWRKAPSNRAADG